MIKTAYIVSAMVVGLTVMIPTRAYATQGDAKTNGDVRQNVEARQEARLEIKDQFKSALEERKNAIQSLFRQRAVIGSAKLTAKNGTTLTVAKDGKSYTVQTDEKTMFRRRFWGSSELNEMQIGDTVNIIGQWENEQQTTVQARLIRDISIQKRFGVFVGLVKTLTANGFQIEAAGRGTQTVTVDGSTRILNRLEQPIDQETIEIGHRVRVRGLWDSTSNTITEVVQIKDFSHPIK